MSLTTPDRQAARDQLTELIEELLDAHCDTVCLSDELACDPQWAAHRDYLQGLQRVGQRTLALLDN